MLSFFLASKKFMFFILALIVLIQPLMSQAVAVTANDSDLCVYATHKYERAFDIKPHLLTTISHVETGRFDANKKTSAPWPWTINVNGKGMYLKSKKEAVNKVKELQKRGYKSIDVGCMQINLKYHGKAFDSVEDALDVDSNVYYAASFLTDLYERNDNNWDTAVMHYHSKRESKGSRYKQKIDERIKIVEDIFASNYRFLVIKKKASQKAQEWREAKLEEYRKKKDSI